MMVEMKVKFCTPVPLSQQDGLKMWERATHFMAMPGSATYQLTSRGEADSIPDAVEGLCAQITEICEASDRRWTGVQIVKIEAEAVAA